MANLRCLFEFILFVGKIRILCLYLDTCAYQLAEWPKKSEWPTQIAQSLITAIHCKFQSPNNMTIYLIQLCSPRKRKPVERLAEDGMPVPTGGERPLDGIFFCISFTAAGSRECCGSRENSTTVVD